MALISLGRIKDSAKVYKYVKDLEKDLGINRYYSRLIQIRFRKDLDDCLGLCWGTEKFVYIDIWKSGDMNQMMQTLAHEMVHAKQFIKKELVDGYMYKLAIILPVTTRHSLGRYLHMLKKKSYFEKIGEYHDLLHPHQRPHRMLH